eukprot:358715-Chlamydomonas_euryale.AAC.7
MTRARELPPSASARSLRAIAEVRAGSGVWIGGGEEPRSRRLCYMSVGGGATRAAGMSMHSRMFAGDGGGQVKSARQGLEDSTKRRLAPGTERLQTLSMDDAERRTAANTSDG